jgi:hypothetical protein
MRISLVMAIVVSSMLLGCSDSTSTDVASSLNGAWKLQFDPPEGFFGFSLAPSGSDVTGEGSFVGEAGPEGSLSVTGTVVENTVDLDFILVTQLPEGQPTRTAHFTGHLTFGRLEGKLRYGPIADDNPAQPAVFLRDN